MIALTTNPEQTAGTLTGPPDTQVYAVVGFDGSASALRALDAAARLLNDRPGGMQIVYVAHLSALLAGGDVGGRASAEVLQGFDDAPCRITRSTRSNWSGARYSLQSRLRRSGQRKKPPGTADRPTRKAGPWD
jgi:hypothetical protein